MIVAAYDTILRIELSIHLSCIYKTLIVAAERTSFALVRCMINGYR